MPLLAIESERLRLSVLAPAGASVASLAVRIADDWLPILRPTPPDAVAQRNASLFSSFALAPWSNRVRDARFVFAGREHVLRPNTPEGHAIHGDVRKRPWRTIAEARSRLAFAFDSREHENLNFPFPFSCDLSYAVDGPRLTMSLSIRNEGAEPMPAGLGFHPYWRRSLLARDDDVEVEMAATGVYRELLPTTAAVPLAPGEDFRRSRPLGTSVFDHCFAGWDGRAVVRWPRSGIQAVVEASEPFRHVVLFAPRGKDFFAVEPVSHANDGFNLLARGVPGSGVRVLEPGTTLGGSVQLEIAA